MRFSIRDRGGDDRKQDRLPPSDERMSDKQLEMAQKLARETLKADHQAIERYAKFAVSASSDG
jgi:hypothetical protein